MASPSALAQEAAAAAPAAAPAAAAAAAAAPQALTAANINTGDTAWILVSSALVLLMFIPGLCLFYGGMVRKKNVLSIFMQCMAIMCLVSVQWVVIGYSIAFGPDAGGGLFGQPALLLKGILGASETMIPHFDTSVILTAADGAKSYLSYAGTIPQAVFVIFQMMFATITPALIIGAVAERVKFWPLCIFMVLWATLVYDPIAHWVWGVNGLIGVANAAGTGSLDFAGGTVVHIAAGFSALAFCLFLGKRKGYPNKMSPPHNLPFVVIGAGLLWFGWFGFNAGSALAANGVAANAFLMTHVATCLGGLTWAVLDFLYHKKPTLFGITSGAIAGLVGITPACGFVSLTGALCIGVIAGVATWIFVTIVKPKLGYDDSLDVFNVHGVGGVCGALATGIFATTAMNFGSGAVDGNWSQMVQQVKGVALTGVYAFVVSYILILVINAFMKLRATEEEESIGLDVTEHKESAYTVID